jgi:hypothetical protein
VAVIVLAMPMNDQLPSYRNWNATNATPNGMNSACGVRS